MIANEALALLGSFAEARDEWLADTTASLHASAVWLAGSLGRGDGDVWSDIDLLVVGGSTRLDQMIAVKHQPMLTLPVSHNGPLGGGYIGAMYDVGPIPLWVDWYAWPTELPVPSGARLLSGRGVAGTHTLFEALDCYGRGPYVESPREAFTLAMLPIIAKFVARSDRHAAETMARMLDIDTTSIIDGLGKKLATIEADPVIRDRISRHIEVAAAVAQESGHP